MIPLYLVWSLIYIPFIIATIIQNISVVNNYLISFNIPSTSLIVLGIILLPLIIIIALVYTGIYYHLWYFPALIISLLVLRKWKKKFKVKYLLVISFILLLFGATETYFGVLPLTLQELLTYYYKIFFTTRNFLFFGLFYVVLGYYIGMKDKPYSYLSFIKFIVSIILLIFEGVILHDTARINSNILLFSIPVVYYLFLSILYFDSISDKSSKHFRFLSKYYYLIHPAVIFFFMGILNKMNDNLNGTFLLLLIVIVITHIITVIILQIKKHYPKLII